MKPVTPLNFSLLQSITDDDVDRISLCLRVLANRTPLMKDIFTVECRRALSNMLESNKKDQEETRKVNDVSSIFVRSKKVYVCVHIVGIRRCIKVNANVYLFTQVIFYQKNYY